MQHMTDHDLADQVSTLIMENRAYRVARQTVEDNYHELKVRYNALADDIEGIRSECDRRVREMTIERDRAVTAANEVKGLLGQVADLVLQASRAATGDSTPQNIPDRVSKHIEDHRLPPPSLGTSDPVLADLLERLPRS